MTGALLSPEVFVTAVLLVTAWAVILCLRIFAAELAHQETRHDLTVKAQIIRRRQMEKLQQFQASRSSPAKRAANPPNVMPTATDPNGSPAEVGVESGHAADTDDVQGTAA